MNKTNNQINYPSLYYPNEKNTNNNYAVNNNEYNYSVNNSDFNYVNNQNTFRGQMDIPTTIPLQKLSLKSQPLPCFPNKSV